MLMRLPFYKYKYFVEIHSTLHPAIVTFGLFVIVHFADSKEISESLMKVIELLFCEL